MTRHIIIPDCQVKPEVDHSYLEWIGKYICEKKPDTVIQIGDFADLPSLSSYDVGKKSFEGRRYKKDLETVHFAMERLLSPLQEFNGRARRNKERQYKPRLVLTLGNHENRITRVVDSDPKLEGTISLGDLKYEEFGWEVYDFLAPVVIDGFVTVIISLLAFGRPVTSARALVQKKHMSCVQGHHQNWEMHREVKADGTPVIGLFSGSCYLHDEAYLGPQGNNYWRGIWMLNEVKEGDFQPMMVSLDYLKKKYS